MPLQILERTQGGNDDKQPFRRLFEPASMPVKISGECCFLDATETEAASTPDLMRIESEAYEKGYLKGQQEGLAAARDDIKLAIESLSKAAAGLAELQQSFARKSEERLVELALAIGRKVVGYEIAANRQVVVNIARQALKSVGNLHEVNVKMNPDDLRFLQDNQMTLSELAPQINEVKVEATDSIEPGGCVIESSCGVIDAQVESQLQRIEKAFQLELSKLDKGQS